MGFFSGLLGIEETADLKPKVVSKELEQNRNMVITEELLTKLSAHTDLKKWWVNNGLTHLKVKDLYKIRGDYNYSISRLKDIFRDCSFDSSGNMLTEKLASDNSAEYTYDSSGNVLTRSDSNGYYEKYTYDSSDRLLTVRTSDGYFEEHARTKKHYTIKVDGKVVLTIPLKKLNKTRGEAMKDVNNDCSKCSEFQAENELLQK